MISSDNSSKIKKPVLTHEREHSMIAPVPLSPFDKKLKIVPEKNQKVNNNQTPQDLSCFVTSPSSQQTQYHQPTQPNPTYSTPHPSKPKCHISQKTNPPSSAKRAHPGPHPHPTPNKSQHKRKGFKKAKAHSLMV